MVYVWFVSCINKFGPSFGILVKSSKVHTSATVPLRFIVLFLLTGVLWSPGTTSFSVYSATPAPGAGGSGGADCTILPMMLLDLSRLDLTHSCCKTLSKVNLNVISGSKMCRTIDFAFADIWSLTLDLQLEEKRYRPTSFNLCFRLPKNPISRHLVLQQLPQVRVIKWHRGIQHNEQYNTQRPHIRQFWIIRRPIDHLGGCISGRAAVSLAQHSPSIGVYAKAGETKICQFYIETSWQQDVFAF